MTITQGYQFKNGFINKAFGEIDTYVMNNSFLLYEYESSYYPVCRYSLLSLINQVERVAQFFLDSGDLSSMYFATSPICSFSKANITIIAIINIIHSNSKVTKLFNIVFKVMNRKVLMNNKWLY